MYVLDISVNSLTFKTLLCLRHNFTINQPPGYSYHDASYAILWVLAFFLF